MADESIDSLLFSAVLNTPWSGVLLAATTCLRMVFVLRAFPFRYPKRSAQDDIRVLVCDMIMNMWEATVRFTDLLRVHSLTHTLYLVIAPCSSTVSKDTPS